VEVKKPVYLDRSYRKLTRVNGLTYFTVMEKESDLYIAAIRDLSHEALVSLKLHRSHIENYIRLHDDFLYSLVPLPFNPLAPSIVRDMMEAASKAGVGPMAAVAGAIAEYVGRDLLAYSSEVIVENGGDIYAATHRPLEVGIFAGESPLSGKVKILLQETDMPAGICTSSGTVGPSLSFGKADAVCIISSSASLADAAASAVGNRVKNPRDIEGAITFGKNIPGVKGIVIIMGKHMGVWGSVNLKFT